MPRVPESFYEPDGDHYVATELTRGPWDPGAQHAGPPAAVTLNQFFPTQSGNPDDDFVEGDVIGTIDLTGVKLR